MIKDDVLEKLLRQTSRESGVSEAETEKAISETFKGLNKFLTSGVKRVKIPYLGTFRQKQQKKEE
jgi:nucleoid DNA-binding protein